MFSVRLDATQQEQHHTWVKGGQFVISARERYALLSEEALASLYQAKLVGDGVLVDKALIS